jgi:two-component system, OmpR family, sensor kinase
VQARLNIDRLPLRLRLTLAYSGAIALMLVAIGSFVYFHFRAGLDSGLEQGLRTRTGDLATLVREQGAATLSPTRPLIDRAESFAQVLDPRGRVLEASPRLGVHSLLSASEIRATAHGTLLLTRGEDSRLFARRLKTSPPVVVVAGVDLDQRENAIETLGAALLIGGPLALLLASLAGYGLASGALRPVARMRERAQTISAEHPEGRLPLPAAQDEIYRLGTTLNAVFERLEHALKHERAFIADASHQLRTPLAIIQAEIEVALRKDKPKSELRAVLESAGEEAERLTRLAEDLLLIARSEDGGLPLATERVEVGELMSSITERFGARGHEAGRRISVTVPNGIAVTADRESLEQAISNLVDNALRYGDGDIELRAAGSERAVELHVSDAGAGFPDSFLPRAFDRFSRGSRGRAGGGTGLGLAIVAAIARAHGGEVGAANGGPLGGADVWLTLPAAEAR